MSDQPRRRRKLAAILMADVVGFSRLMGQDEEGTTDRILTFHERVRVGVERHGGRVVGTAGDSVFGDFDSIIEALDCAAEIQRALHAENVGRAHDDRIDARIGLHLGDVIVEERNVFGEGVNVAARLEQLADPGGIMLSEAVYHLVRGRTDLPIERLGTRSLKNIEEPMSLYRIGPEAFGGEPIVAQPPAVTVHGQAEPNERVRDALEKIAARLGEKVEGTTKDSEGVIIDASDSAEIVAPFRVGNLVLMTLGVLGIVARTSGWTDNGWYPFLGAWMLGVAVGGLATRLTRSRGLGVLVTAAGIGSGALFFDNVVMRAILWVITAAMVGTAASRFGNGSRRSRRPTR
jgi:class 3 adenylate cyclase